MLWDNSTRKLQRAVSFKKRSGILGKWLAHNSWFLAQGLCDVPDFKDHAFQKGEQKPEEKMGQIRSEDTLLRRDVRSLDAYGNLARQFVEVYDRRGLVLLDSYRRGSGF